MGTQGKLYVCKKKRKEKVMHGYASFFTHAGNTFYVMRFTFIFAYILSQS